MKYAILLLTLLISGATASQTIDVPTKRFDEGAQLAKELCSSCHANAGVGDFMTYPIISGQNRMYLIKQLEDFKTGSRSHIYMNTVAKKLTPTQIQDVANFYACSGFLSVNQPGCQKDPTKPLDDVK